VTRDTRSARQRPAKPPHPCDRAMERKISVGVDIAWGDELAGALDRAVGAGFDFVATPLFTPDASRVSVPEDAAPLARE